ncbi:MAG: arginine decarboxylase, partial [Planctomycetota bacterium]|nr:arginine decarboxylase [Planctomycetota bacterium]
MLTRPRMQKKKKDPLSRWTVAESVDLYGIERWSVGIFGVNEKGHVVLRECNGSPEVDLKELVDEIRMRGLQLPVLIRFTDILRYRLRRINEAFATAMAEHKYQGQYRG